MFDWREYWSLAQTLINTEGSDYTREDANRTVVSRAYYAAFGVARAYAQTRLGFQASGSARNHHTLTQFLLQQGFMLEAIRLRDLRFWRNQCDYDSVVPALDALAQQSLQIAQQVIAAFQT